MVIARDMQRAGAGLCSLAEPVLDTTGDFAELVLAMLWRGREAGRRRIAERTARGRADAKAKGAKLVEIGGVITLSWTIPALEIYPHQRS
jgi:DNA invertase Pin-like site-specific DNA recombinase